MGPPFLQAECCNAIEIVYPLSINLNLHKRYLALVNTADELLKVGYAMKSVKSDQNSVKVHTEAL